MAERTILHVDMDAFYASIEQRDRPELRGRPVVVGGTGPRGVVAAASYEARLHGVRSAMPSSQARRMCPGVVFLAGDHGRYAEVSRRIMAVFDKFTPVVEPLSLDEAFLDVTGARRRLGDGATVAAAVRAAVLEAERLTCSVGVAASKSLAKLASVAAKPTPGARGPIPGPGVVEVRPGEELAFLAPLPVRALWGIGPATAAKLERRGITSVGELARLPAETLQTLIGGAAGAHVHAMANGVDDRGVESNREARSIGHEQTFATDLTDPAVLGAHLVRLADAVSARLRGAGVGARTISLKARFGDFRTVTRAVTGDVALDDGPRIARVAGSLLARVGPHHGIRLLGLHGSNLEVPDSSRQLRLGEDPGPSRPRPVAAIDDIRARFGPGAIGPLTLLGLGEGRAGPGGGQLWGPDEPSPDGGGPGL